MVITNGGMWLDSKNIRIVGGVEDTIIHLYLKDVPGVVNLQYKSKEMAYAVRIILILDLDPKDKKMKSTYEYLIGQAKINGINIKVLQSYLKEFIEGEIE